VARHGRLQTWFIGWLAATLLRALARTVRFDGHVESTGTDPSVATARGAIYALWHDAILIPLARHNATRPRIAALVSRHQDGSYLTEFLRRQGIRAVRGSTSRGGDRALRALMNQENDWHIFITPDGPRGPEHVIKEGIVYLASRTGRPIVPIASQASSAWCVRGRWTGMWVPKPFSRCHYLLGTPIHVAPDLSRDALARERDRVQAEMERVAEKLARIVRGEEPRESFRRAA
jgi:lysophospholipid acyltransferase (LPLAT)-like uncharacterized protein